MAKWQTITTVESEMTKKNQSPVGERTERNIITHATQLGQICPLGPKELNIQSHEGQLVFTIWCIYIYIPRKRTHFP